jgi:hypothetical protein
MGGTESYSVSTATGVCAVTGETIPVGDPCMSMLAESPETDGLVRLDVGIDVWAGGARPPAPGPVVGVWRTVVPEKDAPRRQLVGEDEVVDLFEQLADAEDPRQVAFRYLLCLILIRKRKLVWEGAEPASGDRPGLLRVRRPRDKESEPIEVADPGMDDDAIADATRRLSMVMNLDEAGKDQENE